VKGSTQILLQNVPAHIQVDELLQRLEQEIGGIQVHGMTFVELTANRFNWHHENG
jgi:Co/Zn/Cd efflux system component